MELMTRKTAREMCEKFHIGDTVVIVENVIGEKKTNSNKEKTCNNNRKMQALPNRQKRIKWNRGSIYIYGYCVGWGY